MAWEAHVCVWCFNEDILWDFLSPKGRGAKETWVRKLQRTRNRLDNLELQFCFVESGL